jgi:hypothetical protein
MYAATWYRLVSKGGWPRGMGSSGESCGSGVGALVGSEFHTSNSRKIVTYGSISGNMPYNHYVKLVIRTT